MLPPRAAEGPRVRGTFAVPARRREGLRLSVYNRDGGRARGLSGDCYERRRRLKEANGRGRIADRAAAQTVCSLDRIIAGGPGIT